MPLFFLIESNEQKEHKKNGKVLMRSRGQHPPLPLEGIKLESFESVSKYGRALQETPWRLADQVAAQSRDETELVEVRRRSTSEHKMKKTLMWWYIIWLGGCFAYLRVELGEFEAFIATGNILLEYIIGGSAVSCSLKSYFATCCNQPSDKFFINAHGLTNSYNQLDPMVVAVLVTVTLLDIFSMEASSRLDYVASIVHILVLLFIINAGLTKANPNNYSTFVPFGTHGIFQDEAVLFFAYVVSDAVSTMAEENKDPERDIPLGLRIHDHNHSHILPLGSNSV